MKKALLYCCIILLAFLLQNCVKEVNTSSEQINSAPLPSARQSTLSAVSLTVNIANDYTDAMGNLIQYKIKNDGLQYVDGADYVKAQIDQNGNFYFSTNASKNSLPKRFVIYDLSDPVDPTNTYSAAFGRGYYNQYNYIFSTGNSPYGSNPFIPLQSLQVGASECLSMTGNVNGDGVNSIFKYTIRFHATKDDLSDSPTAFAFVTRISETEWLVEPSACGSPNNVGALWTGDTRNEVFKGYFHLPFSFKLTKR